MTADLLQAYIWLMMTTFDLCVVCVREIMIYIYDDNKFANRMLPSFS